MRERFGRGKTVLVAAAVVLSMVVGVGAVAAQSVSVTQSETQVTASPGETVTLTTTLVAEDVNGPAVDVDLPAGWVGQVTDADGGQAKPPTGTSNVLQVVWLGSGTYEVTYQFTVPQNAGAGDYTVSVEGSGLVAGSDGRVEDSTSTTVTVEEPPEPANFQVTNLAAPSTITDSETFELAATVENTGDRQGTQTVEFTFDGSVEGTEAVTLAPGESQEVFFSEGSLSPGQYSYGVSTANDSVSDTVTVEETPPATNYQVTDLEAPASATQGTAIDVSANVSNEGLPGQQEVQFRLDVDGDGTLESDEVLASRSVELDRGETRTVEFSDLDTSTLDTRTYEHGIFTENDSETATIDIELPPVNDFANPPNDENGDGKYRDVNGDGEVNVVDVQALFANRDGPTVQNNVDEFDFNDDGKVDVVDAQALFDFLTGVVPE